MWVWLLLCCKACPRPNHLELNLIYRPACSRSRRLAVLDRSRSPAITLHGVVSGANIEVVPLPNGSQMVALGMQASTKSSLSSANAHESLPPQVFSSVCSSRRLLPALSTIT